MARRAAKYRRISEDREGRELGISRQDEDLDALGKRRDLVYVASYVDNDIGASAKSRKPRPDYQRMLADARAGKFEVIAAYTTGRVTRRPREFEDLIDLSIDHGIDFAYVRSPEFDLRTAQGRRIARTLAAQDAGESEEISERVSRDARRRAEQGGNHGGRRCFGFTKDGMHLVPSEAAQIVWMADELLRGTPIGTITRELNDRPIINYLLDNRDLLDAHPVAESTIFLMRYADGMSVEDIAARLRIRKDRAKQLSAAVIKRQRKLLQDAKEEAAKVPGLHTTVTGRLWTPSTVRDLLRLPRLAGLSVHRGKVVGKGQWPAILPPEQHHAIVALVTDPARRTTTGNRAAYLLSGLAKCSVCGNSVTSFGVKRDGGRSPRALYRCRPNACVAVRRTEADLYVTERVFERLSRPDAAELLVDQEAPNLEALQTEAHAIRLRLDEAAASFARPDGIDARQLDIITRSLNDRLKEIEQLQQHTSRAPILRDLIEAGERMEQVWDDMTLDRQRAVVQCLMLVEILPGGSGKRDFDPAKVRITPKE
ncbi:recombinase family protein [Plantactinospora sp. WMMB334]|uniref:recombinase family protein n=1 Tax=Plantactinospora sp. WMMB334 TaxID=3404119 RepID=UPI003B93838B